MRFFLRYGVRAGLREARQQLFRAVLRKAGIFVIHLRDRKHRVGFFHSGLFQRGEFFELSCSVQDGLRVVLFWDLETRVDGVVVGLLDAELGDEYTKFREVWVCSLRLWDH